MKEKYKETVVGRIPDIWKDARLADIGQIILGQSPPSATYNKKGVGLPFFQGKAEFGDKYPIPTIYCSKPIKISEQNDILLSVRAPVGEVNISPLRCCIGRGLAALRPSKTILNYIFLYYYLKFSKSNLQRFSAGSTFKAITGREIETFPVPVPPLAEQKRIASILSDLDDAIQKADEAIAETEYIKNGLMNELFTKGIGHKEVEDREIGKVPKAWKVIKMGEVLELCQYGLSVKLAQEGEYKIIKMDNIANGRVTVDNIRFTDIDEQTFKTFRLYEGDILFNRTNSYELVGRTGIFDLQGEYVFASYLIRLRVKKELISPKFLTHYLIYSNKRVRQLAARAVQQANINATNLKKLKIPLPSLTEQKKITAILSDIDKKLDLQKQKKETLIQIKKGLMNDLLTGKRRVKVH